jgi:hypothetical protein
MTLMKRALMGMALVVGLLSSTGCNLFEYRRNCNHCNGNLGCRPCNLGWQRGGTDYQRFLGHSGGPAAPSGAYGAGGPPTAQVAYPYYTVRGPRDFLAAEPPSIGR